MIEFLCSATFAPFCVSETYAPVTEMAGFGFRHSVLGPDEPFDSSAAYALGARALLGFPDLLWPISARELTVRCGADRCVYFRGECDSVSLVCSWQFARTEGSVPVEDVSLSSSVMVYGANQERLVTALAQFAVDLGPGGRVVMTDIAGSTDRWETTGSGADHNPFLTPSGTAN